MNADCYPRLYYPELYVLGGGYCEYWRCSRKWSTPMGYVTMNDPQYMQECQEGLNQLRKFSQLRKDAVARKSRTRVPLLPPLSIFKFRVKDVGIQKM